MAQGEPDTSVKLPEAVVRAAARATELANQARADRENSIQNAQQVVDRTKSQMTFADVRSGTPPAPPEIRSVNPNRMPQREAAPQPQQRQQLPQSQQNQVYTEQQFRSMQGRWEREQQNNQALLRRLNEMQELVATMNVGPQGNGQNQPQYQVGQGDVRFNQPQQRLVTDKERQEYGEDLVDVMGRRAREAVDPELAGLRNEISRLNQQMNGMNITRQNEKRGNVYDELKKEVPDWDQINENPEFLRWLDGFAPYTGATKKSLLKSAMDRNQSDLVIDFFKDFKAELAASGPAQDRGPPSGNGAESSWSGNASYSGSNTATTPAVDLMQYAAPGRARPGQTQTPPEKPMISRAEIKQLYDMKKLGKFAGREQEFQRFENLVFEAQREGRITP